jgi:alkylation response protein AidB-like acyl-CoA dehydrogenase
MRMCAVPAADVEILDTWHTTGLNGTASNDVRVEGVRVPGERTFSLFDTDAVDPAPLYSWRWMFVVKLAAVPLGIARAAYEEATEIASTKRTMPTLALAREDATVQDAVGRARASVGSARAYMQDRVGAFWDGLLDGRPPTPQEWADVRLAMTHAAHTSKQAVTLLYEVLGTSGVYRKSPLDRQLRDVTTLAQHLVCQSKTYAAAGRSLLGLEAGIAGF